MKHPAKAGTERHFLNPTRVPEKNLQPAPSFIVKTGMLSPVIRSKRKMSRLSLPLSLGLEGITTH